MGSSLSEEIDLENEWIIYFTFLIQLFYCLYIIFHSIKGGITDMEMDTVIFQFAAQYFYIWYFIQQGSIYPAIGISLLALMVIASFIASSYHRTMTSRHYHETTHKCTYVKYKELVK